MDDEDEDSIEQTLTEYVGIALSDSAEENANTDPLPMGSTSANQPSDNNGEMSLPNPTKTSCSTTLMQIQDALPDLAMELA